MRGRTGVFALVALSVVLSGAVAWVWWRQAPSLWRRWLGGEPPAATTERGPVVPVSDYRLSGPYTHDNLTVFLVHGPETLDGKSFLTLREALAQGKAVVHE